MKRITSFLATTLIFANSISSAFAASGVTNGTMKVGDSTAKISTIQMPSTRTLEVLVANDTIDTHQSGRNMIANGSKNGSEIVSAVNGGFFSLSDWSVHNTMVEDGRLIAGGGWSNAAGISYDGKLLIGKVKLCGVATVKKKNGASYRIGADSINKIESSSSVSFLNEFCRNNTKVPKGGVAFFVEDGIVKGTMDEGIINPMSHQDIIVYKASAIEKARSLNQLPEIGDRVSFGIDSQADDPEMKPHWDNAKSVMGGAVTLVERGKNVAHRNSYAAADQTPNSVRQRVFVAEMLSGELVMGTVNSSYVKIADALISKGAVNAVAMDGGSSSMLYSNGSFLKTPGRELTMGLAVVDQSEIARIPNTEKIQEMTEVTDSKPEESYTNNMPLTPEEQEDMDTMRDFLNAVNQQMTSNKQPMSSQEVTEKQEVDSNQKSSFVFSSKNINSGDIIVYPDGSNDTQPQSGGQSITPQINGMLPPTTITPNGNQNIETEPFPDSSITPPQGETIDPGPSMGIPTNQENQNSGFVPSTSVNNNPSVGDSRPVVSEGSSVLPELSGVESSNSGILSTGKPQSAESGASTGKPEPEIGSLVGGNLSARGFADVMIKLIEKKSNTSILTIAQNSGHQVQTKDDALISLGIIPSIPNSGEVSRKTASVAIAKAHTMLTGGNISDITSISDCGRISEEEIMSINYVVKNKMLNLTNGLFFPNKAITMTEMNQVVSVF